jgi:hypothetical protein
MASGILQVRDARCPQEAALGRLRQQPPQTPIEMRVSPPAHFAGKPYLKWQGNSPISGKHRNSPGCNLPRDARN